MSQNDYVHKVLDAYRPTPTTAGHLRRSDRLFAADLDHLTAAVIDRLTENSHVINMKNWVSLRPKLAADV